MATADRRRKGSVNESYAYLRELEDGNSQPELFKLIKALQAVCAALRLSDSEGDSDAGISGRMWRCVYRALFDTLITSFPGYVILSNENGEIQMPRSEFPEDGYLEFRPDQCKRTHDEFRMPLRDLLPGTRYYLALSWKLKGPRISPADFPCEAATFCSAFVRQSREVSDEEVKAATMRGRKQAHDEWRRLHREVSRAPDSEERQRLLDCMDDLESVWGSLSQQE